ncbi:MULTISPECIES: hydantoinase B/oxoprolinase family protein [Amycolatopsis]|uniref:hydantoinase B/oxoprolinase family protein n=1 Tax=Amycolatopsis TaxID=1813 RepID=UPI00106E50A2|nr:MULTISPECIES: hydantoinase B/oxoprolinase family protein [Amycolatopsis]
MTSGTLDPAQMAVIANRLDTIVREMTSTLLRAGRSSVIAVARDFSCSIVTGEDELLASAEGLPVHIFGAHLQTAELRRRHPDLRDGDAYLDNDPYVGGSHHADHTIMVPVFVGDTHLFTAVAKSHQADIGNSMPTTYFAMAKDVYEEGALNFPCVQVQRDREDISDVIEMCRRRIRVPDQWYGDYLATLGAARTGERRLKELVDVYGLELIRQFVAEWFDYSERRMTAAISALPSGRYVRHGQHDSVGPLPPIPLKVDLTVDAEAGRVSIDLRDNPDCVPAGLNMTRSTATNMAIAGLFNNIDPTVPHNAGAFRRVEVLLRENCVVGIPRHPTSASMATTNVADRLVNLAQSALGEAGTGHGVAEGGTGMGPGMGVISGTDWRTGMPFVNQMFVANNGGPASRDCDGWLTWILPVCAGLLYRDSIEINEQKYPVQFDYVRLLPDSGGPGRHRGANAMELAYTARGNPVDVVWTLDAHESPPNGIHGGGPGATAAAALRHATGEVTDLPGTGAIALEPGQYVLNTTAGGGGFGDPRTRDADAVLHDVAEGYVTRDAAAEVYGVVIVGEGHAPRVDHDATQRRRAALGAV